LKGGKVDNRITLVVDIRITLALAVKERIGKLE
jgi:hypothetical protein